MFAGWRANCVSFTATAPPDVASCLPLTNAVNNEGLSHAGPLTEDAVGLFKPTAGSVDSGWTPGGCNTGEAL